MGRQPWVVYGLMKTSQAISPTVGTASVAATLGIFVVLYSVLGVVDAVLMARFARRRLIDPHDEEAGPGHEPALVY
jgi:cytochrome d ubiquinol oxidase subunit I